MQESNIDPWSTAARSSLLVCVVCGSLESSDDILLYQFGLFWKECCIVSDLTGGVRCDAMYSLIEYSVRVRMQY